TPAVTQGGGTSGLARINFNGGTLKATMGSNPGSFVDTSITTSVQAGGAIIDTNGNSFSMSNNFVHDTSGPATDGGFTKAGSGILTISGANTYTGPTAVSGGTLDLQNGAPSTTSGFIANGILINHSQLQVTNSKFLKGSGTVDGGAVLQTGST